jgi:CheY-like chemotaxis protein
MTFSTRPEASRLLGHDTCVTFAAMTLARFENPYMPLVLVVEDDPDAREIYAMTLRSDGFRVAEAENGAMALEKALVLRPDAILLDHAMPVMDGRETARRLRANARTHDTPLVMLTGFGEGSAQDKALRADGNCDAYLVKPCGADEVFAALRAAMHRCGRVLHRIAVSEYAPKSSL